jgi:hypothetical protein
MGLLYLYLYFATETTKTPVVGSIRKFGIWLSTGAHQA